MNNRWSILLGVLLSSVGAFAMAADFEVQLVIKNHRFEPTELKVPAGQRVKLVIDNRDDTAEEFESHDLNREKLIPAKSKVTVFVGPLKRRRYAFVGEYHEATARGFLIAE